MIPSKEKGFTIIELLVVVSIIGLLASSALAATSTSLNTAVASAFVQSVRQMQVALEVYKTDTGVYPYETDATQQNFGLYYTGSVLTDEITPAMSSIIAGYLPRVFTPGYIRLIPKITPQNNKILYYRNAAAATALTAAGYTCEGKPIKNYLLLYAVSITDTKDVNAPRYLFSGSPYTYIGGLSYHCFTGH